MKIIKTLNIFEAAYYLTDPDCSLEYAIKERNGNINYYIISDRETAKTMRKKYIDGLANVNLHVYLWEYGNLLKINNEIEKELSLKMEVRS